MASSIVLGTFDARGIVFVVSICVFRELSRWTINPIFCKQLSSLGHGDISHLDGASRLAWSTAKGGSPPLCGERARVVGGLNNLA